MPQNTVSSMDPNSQDFSPFVGTEASVKLLDELNRMELDQLIELRSSLEIIFPLIQSS